MMVCMDANHAHDLVTRKIITGILLILNNTPVRWVSNCNLSSQLVATRAATELILKVRFMLRSLGVDLGGPVCSMLSDE
jgi:hypothetical protein